MEFRTLIDRLGSAVAASSETSQNPQLVGVTPIDEAIAGTISYIEGDKFAHAIASTQASAIILPLDSQLQARADDRDLPWIAAAEPRLLFAQTISVFFQPFHPQPGIDPTAVVAADVKLGRDVYIGAHVVIHSGVTIGDRTKIHANAVVYPNVEIGADVILHANCTLHERSRIGDRCVIHSGAAIGAEGFGFVPTATGWFKMEQAGYTVLEEGVEVGCNSCIDRPAVGETRIGKETKLDNLVHIGHGCKIGSYCALAAQVGLAGGVKVGNRVLLGGQVGIANQVTIGDRAMASAKAGIHNDIEPGAVVSGFPAISHKMWLKTSAIVNRLPEMYRVFQKLGKGV
jgi:UDP-3-O-[3-hydroxymyristoyl] glucosamine N-acyltransferase